MKVLPDDDLRERVRELGSREASGAPPLDRLIGGSRSARDHATGGPRVSDRLRRGAVLTAACAVLIAIVWRWPATRPAETPAVSRAESPADPMAGWDLPTDGLLIETVGARGDVDGLSREIEGLLAP